MDDVNVLAQVLKAKLEMNLQDGIIVANPIPETAEMAYEFINQAIEQALVEADDLGVTGKKITPFLLDRISQITKGISLKANIQLVLNNARLAAELAVAMSKE